MAATFLQVLIWTGCSSMAQFSEEENLKDAHGLGQFDVHLESKSKPTLAMVHGGAFGGGAGLAAACDIAIAAETARFCFSETKLGLSPPSSVPMWFRP